MRKTITVLSIIVLLAAAGFLFVRQNRFGQDQELQILRRAAVDFGPIASTVSATGTIEPEASVSLSFGVVGTVQQVNVIRGQRVTTGDVLATLDTGELTLAVQQAEDTLRIQQLTLQQALESAPSPSALASAQADLDASIGNLVIAEANLAAAEAARAQAVAQKAQILAGPSAGQIAAAEMQVTDASVQQRNAEQAHNKTLECITITLPTGESREECPGLGPAEEQARSNLELANVALEVAEEQLADLLAGPRPADIQAADAAIAAADAQISSAEGSILVAEANIARAEAGYDRLLEGPGDEEIAILEAQVAAAETNLDLARLRLQQAMIVAPMDGQVANVLVSPGEKVTLGAPAISVVNRDAFHIEVSVDEIDIDQVGIGQAVEINLDALPDQIVSGMVAEIAPTAVTTGVGVVTYQVTINIEEEDVALRPGMTANASIMVEEVERVLRVPNWAVRLDRETGRAFVNRLSGESQVEEITIETGLRNEQFSEIVSGLEAGDTVVVTDDREGFSFFGN